MIKAKAEALRMSRVERGWDMTRLAQEAKVTQATISRVERGSSTSPSTAKKVADALGRPVAELFTIS